MSTLPPPPDRTRSSEIAPTKGRASEVFLAALALGLTSFGGPIAHLAYFRDAYVIRRRWLGEQAFADLVTLCQVLPGPASTQLGIAIGTLRAGVRGGIAAWLGFTLPSAAIMVAFAAVYPSVDLGGAGWLHGLALAAGAVVMAAVVGMARALLPEAGSWVIALAAAVAALIWVSPIAQISIIVAGALAGWRWLHTPGDATQDEPSGTSAAARRTRTPSRRAGIALALFAGLLVGLPVLRAALPGDGSVALADAFYRAGALVFGGGHVVLPLLQASVVEPGWVTPDAFLAGYGAAQAMPGPLFTVAGFLGSVAAVGPGGLAGAVIALGAIFLPSLLLVVGTLTAWPQGRPSGAARRALGGATAAVIGLLAGALIGAVLPAAVRGPLDAVVVMIGTALLIVLRVHPIVVVAAAAVAGGLMAP